MSQNRPNAPHFKLDQDEIAIDQLLTLRIELGNTNHSRSTIWYKQSYVRDSSKQKLNQQAI
jgi:hypothetical protein